MTLKDIREQLVINNEEQSATTSSVDALTKVMVERFKIEDRSKLDELEALRESSKKSDTGARASVPTKTPDQGGFGFDDLLNRFALPGLVALGASLTGFDAAIKALKIPDYLSSIRTAFNTISDTFSTWTTRATDLVDRFKTFKLPELPDLPRLQITWPESWSNLASRITTAISDAIPSVDDIKAKLPKILLPETWTTFIDNAKTQVSNLIPTIDDIKARLPKLELPEIGTLYNNLKTSIANIFPSVDDVKAKLPKLVIPDGITTFYDNIKTSIANILPSLDDVNARFPKLEFPAFTTFYDSVKTSLSNIFPSLDDINAKLPKLTIPDNTTTFYNNLKTSIANIFPSLDDINAKLPKLEFPALDTFYDDIKTSIAKIFPSLDDIKAKLPTIELPKFELLDANGQPWKFPDISGIIPDSLKNLEMPDLTAVKTFFVGTEAGGGVLGFFQKLGSLIADIPGLKTAFRLVGGPVTQAIVSLIDFFTGFYKGFVEVEYDEFGNEIERSFTDKVLGGLEGGMLGLVKGITEAFDLLFIKLPAWLLEKLGMEDAAEFLKGFSLTALVDPIWNGIKSIFNFFTDAEYRKEIITGLKENFTSWINEKWNDITTSFSEAFDAIPTPRELYDRLIQSLPQWMRPDTAEEKIRELETKGGVTREEVLATQGNREQIEALARRADANSYSYGYNEAIEAMQAILTQVPQAARGGFTLPKMPQMGQLMRIHPNELIVPLDQSEEGRALSQLSRVLNTTTADLQNAQRESGRLAASASNATVINNIIDNSTRSSSNINNASNYSAPLSTEDRAMPVMLY